MLIGLITCSIKYYDNNNTQVKQKAHVTLLTKTCPICSIQHTQSTLILGVSWLRHNEHKYCYSGFLHALLSIQSIEHITWILLFVPETTCLIFFIVSNAVIGAMDIKVTPAAPRKSHWTYFAICTTVVNVMVTSIVFSLLFIAPGYQIYINYLLNVNNY